MKSIVLLLFIMLITEKSAKNYRIHLNKNINLTEWKIKMVKSYKALDQTQCLLDCSRVTKCALITYSKIYKNCKYYNDFLSNGTKLFESNGNVIFDYIQSTGYQLKGTQVKKTNADSAITSIVQLLNGNLACAQGTSISIWNIYKWIKLATITSAHSSDIVSLDVLPNGNIVSGSLDKTIKIWNSNTRALYKTLSGPTDSSWITIVKVLKNGNIASADQGGFILIWNSIAGSLRFNLKKDGIGCDGLSQLSNGNLVTVHTNQWVRIWNPITGTLIKQVSLSTVLIRVIGLYNGDFAVGSSLGLITIRDGNTGDIKFTLNGHTGGVSNFVQLENGDLASCSQDNTIKIWDLNTGILKFTLNGHINAVNSLITLPNGYLVSAGGDGNLILWN